MSRLSRLGARLGNWNDRYSTGDTRKERGARWRVVDRIAGWLYRKGDE